MHIKNPFFQSLTSTYIQHYDDEWKANCSLACEGIENGSFSEGMIVLPKPDFLLIKYPLSKAHSL
jgi:hypothetical protein